MRNEAHRLIEEAMLAANVCAAEFIQQAEHPALFRVHEGPTEEKRQTLLAALTSLGLTPNLPEKLKPADLQALALATRDRPDTAQIHMLLLRSMQQALYTPYNNGHFGLSYPTYTHFTSPIRRYPDLLVHRVIKALLAGKRYGLGGASGRGKQAQAEALGAWEQIGLHCSANERRADEASRDVEAWLKCRFMRDGLGEDYMGHVTSVAPFGVFVQLEGLFVDGLVHVTELGGEYFRFDEARQELRGERTGIRYGLGARLHVQVSRVDLDGRRIEFRLFQQATGKPAGKGRVLGQEEPSAVQRLKDVELEERELKRARAAKAPASKGSRKASGGAGAAGSRKTSRHGKSSR
jgi:ribonuclease R